MMTNPWENVCCNGSDLTIGNLDDMECITEHPAFERVVLDRTVLEVAFIQILMYKRSRARAPDELSNTQYRLAAYRQFVSLMMKGEKLGKGNRVVIPSCVTQKIRSEFPSSDNTYCGFKSILDSMNELFQ
ncbi:P2X purinoceptor 7-like [Ruditapes philippinarum]|uniref:P2X purinoceptor 7-like n=1 Tax=Ruditapes philippinarum TaxID=129788 RepID=UPI00295B3220|nr:P2X purinoceptor 7-like [Ruditapes philippinarum]